jgi:hypothetical protein
MQFELMGNTYKVWFVYSDSTYTLCCVERRNSDTGEVETFSDCAVLHPRDRARGRYSHVIGRRVAFAHVLHRKLVPDRSACCDVALRRAFWRAYFMEVRDLQRKMSDSNRRTLRIYKTMARDREKLIDPTEQIIPGVAGLDTLMCPCGLAKEFQKHVFPLSLRVEQKGATPPPE